MRETVTTHETFISAPRTGILGSRPTLTMHRMSPHALHEHRHKTPNTLHVHRRTALGVAVHTIQERTQVHDLWRRCWNVPHRLTLGGQILTQDSFNIVRANLSVPTITPSTSVVPNRVPLRDQATKEHLELFLQGLSRLNSLILLLENRPVTQLALTRSLSTHTSSYLRTFTFFWTILCAFRQDKDTLLTRTQ